MYAVHHLYTDTKGHPVLICLRLKLPMTPTLCACSSSPHTDLHKRTPCPYMSKAYTANGTHTMCMQFITPIQIYTKGHPVLTCLRLKLPTVPTLCSCSSSLHTDLHKRTPSPYMSKADTANGANIMFMQFITPIQ